MSDPLFDRIKQALAQLVASWTARFDYGALYAATVKTQAGDLTLGVVFDDSRFSPVEGIPIRLGLPGVTVKVSPGARVLIGFENQDPSKPRATLWESTNLLELHVDPSVVTVFNGGTQKVGRVGDSVDAGSTMATWIGAVTGVVNGVSAGAAVAPTDFGTISSGADKVKA